MSGFEWVPGVNCDVILTHYKHDPVPLVCYRIQSDPIGPRVKIHFETYWPEENVSRESVPKKIRHLWFYVLTGAGIRTARLLCAPKSTLF